MIIPVTIDTASSTITATGRFPFKNGQQLVVDSRIPKQTPSPLKDYDAEDERVLYFVVNLSGNTFQLSATDNGSAITLTSKGIGQITVSEFPPLTWSELTALPLLEVSTLRKTFTTPESIVNLSAASDQSIGATVASSVFTSGIPHGLLDWGAVRFSSSGTLPAPLVANVTYYARDITTVTAFKVASVVGGSAITITTAGTGQLSFQNVALNEVLETKIAIAMRWLYDALQLKVSNHMKFVSRSWWWWFNPPTDTTGPMFYPAITRALIVLDNLQNPEALIDAIIDFTAWAMIQDSTWRNIVKDAQFFQEFGDNAIAQAKRNAEKRLAGLAPLLSVSGNQGARRLFDFDQTTDSISVSLI